jgi:hypothetical protein
LGLQGLPHGVAGNTEGNKVTKTIFPGSKEFIILRDSEEIISQIIINLG